MPQWGYNHSCKGHMPIKKGGMSCLEEMEPDPSAPGDASPEPAMVAGGWEEDPDAAGEAEEAFMPEVQKTF